MYVTSSTANNSQIEQWWPLGRQRCSQFHHQLLEWSWPSDSHVVARSGVGCLWPRVGESEVIPSRHLSCMLSFSLKFIPQYMYCNIPILSVGCTLYWCYVSTQCWWYCCISYICSVAWAFSCLKLMHVFTCLFQKQVQVKKKMQQYGLAEKDGMVSN